MNKFPIIAPMTTLRDEDAERLNIDKQGIGEACVRLNEIPDLPYRLQQVYGTPSSFEAPQTAEEALYEGFLPDDDAKECRELWNDLDQGLPWRDTRFSDQRLNDLRSRLKARIAPEAMNSDEKSQYRTFVKTRLTSKHQNLNEHRRKIQEMLPSAHDPIDAKLLNELDSHMAELASKYDL